MSQFLCTLNKGFLRSATARGIALETGQHALDPMAKAGGCARALLTLSDAPARGSGILGASPLLLAVSRWTELILQLVDFSLLFSGV